MTALYPVRGIVAGILAPHGVRTVCTDLPWSLHAHVDPGERLFLVPGVWVPIPLPIGWWPWTVGCAELHIATTIWPQPLPRWGVWEAEKYFRERVLPLISGRANRPPDWWKRPTDWVLDGDRRSDHQRHVVHPAG